LGINVFIWELQAYIYEQQIFFHFRNRGIILKGLVLLKVITTNWTWTANARIYHTKLQTVDIRNIMCGIHIFKAPEVQMRPPITYNTMLLRVFNLILIYHCKYFMVSTLFIHILVPTYVNVHYITSVGHRRNTGNHNHHLSLLS